LPQAAETVRVHRRTRHGAAPILLAYFNRQPAGNAGNSLLYTGTNWSNNTFLNFLTPRNPNPVDMVWNTANNGAGTGITNNATFRANAAAAGVPANLFMANPDHVGGAVITLNSHKTRYHALQLEVRRRYAQGLQIISNYTYGNAMQTVFYTHRRGLYWSRDTGGEGDLTHQLKANIVYDLPFGQGRRFLGNSNGFVERLVGGWQVGFNLKIQSGQLVDVGGVRLVGWNESDVQKAFKLRFADDAQQIFMFPEDVIDNTIRAFSLNNTSASGYSGAAPTGRYFAPANGSDCIEVDGDLGECPGARRTLVLTGPMFQQHDVRIAKQTRIAGRVNLEFAAEVLNVFNHPNFVPDGTVNSSTLTDYLVTGLTGTNTSRVIQLVSRINW
jgi:hypothetical protein